MATDDTVVALLRAAFFATLALDEGRFASFDLTFIDPSSATRHSRPDREDDWMLIRFSDPVPFSTDVICRLSPASDARTSLFAVYPSSGGELQISGLIDQGVRTHQNRRYELNWEHQAQPQPGNFQVSAAGVGHLIVYKGFERIGELRGNVVTSNPHPVFNKFGPVLTRLFAVSGRVSKSAERLVSSGEELYTPSSEDAVQRAKALIQQFSASRSYSQTAGELRRLLLRIQGYQHGGAILIPATRPTKDLKVKFPMSYIRLGDALSKLVVTELCNMAAEAAMEPYITDHTPIPVDLFLDAATADDVEQETVHEVNGCLWFIALLSRVDGLILMNKDFHVLGFGTEILTTAVPTDIWLAGDCEGSPVNRTRLEYERYGTRHRSMIRYCAAHPGALGFVVSQDGGVRAFTTADDGELMVWENIQLLRDESLQRVSATADSPDESVT